MAGTSAVVGAGSMAPPIPAELSLATTERPSEVRSAAEVEPRPGTEIEAQTSPGTEMSFAPPAVGSSACTAAGADLEGNMLHRFEALSKMFKSEVETLFGQEKETAKEELERVNKRLEEVELELARERAEAGSAAAVIRHFVSTQQASQMVEVFGEQAEVPKVHPSELDEKVQLQSGAASGALSAGQLRKIVEAFVEVNASQVRPELAEAQGKIRELQGQLEAGRSETARFRAELEEARKLKSQEERDLIEFKSVREKESEVQTTKMEVQHLQAELEELRTQRRQMETRNEQQKAVVKEKSEKIIDLVRQLEEQGEQVRLLSDENNTLRLELGRDAEYLKVVSAPSDPMSYRCAAGALTDDLVSEEKRLREDLRSLAAKFPGLRGQGGQCSRWCELQISRVSDIHRSFLHRLQDYRKEFPEGVKVEFVTPTEEVQSDWAQQEALQREAGAEFQEAEKLHNRRWEEHRLKLTSERDTKVKQLLDQAERSQSKAEKQLLLHQAKLFGQRIDAQLERAWEEQRKERDLRWTQHQQQKQEARQKIRDESLSMVQRAEDKASASSRFTDAASSKLVAVEDAWLRNMEKAASMSASALKSGDLDSSLRALRASTAAAAVSLGVSNSASAEDAVKLPARGSQHTGLGLVLDQVEGLIKSRAGLRQSLRTELEEQSRQQLRSCVEKFIQRETSGNDEEAPEISQAASIVGLLRMRQHRHLSDAMRRQFQDYLLVLRLCSLAALWLLPEGSASPPRVEDLPPLPAELDPECGKATGSAPGAGSRDGDSQQEPSDAAPDDAAVESSFLYKNLCQRLLDRALKLLSEMQRDELLNLKRAYAAEQRIALEHFCQLEAGMVAKVIQQDIKEYELQIATRLLSDSEHQLNQERKQIASRVGEDVANNVAQYKRQLDEEEQALLKDRRKWVMNRIVILQSNGTVNPNERGLLQRLRDELRACESKIEIFDNEFATGAAPSPQPSAEKDVSAPSRPPSGRSSRPSSASRRGRDAGSLLAPAPPEKPSQVPMSPRHRQYMPQPAATGQALPLDPSSASRSESPGHKGAVRQGKASANPPLPQFGMSDACRDSPEFGTRSSQQPIYDWPFDESMAKAVQQPAPPPMLPPRSPGGFSARSLSTPVATRLKPLDCLAPQKSGASVHDMQAGASQPCAGSPLQLESQRSFKLSASGTRTRSSPLLPPVPLTART